MAAAKKTKKKALTKVTPKDVKKPRKKTKSGDLDTRGTNPNSLANLKPWEPGRSGNPKGLRGRTMRTVIRDILEDDVLDNLLQSSDAVESQTRLNALRALEDKMGRKLKNNELMVFQVLGRALKYGDVSAFSALMDRLEGRPVQHNINENSNQGYWEILGALANGQKKDN